VSCGHSDIPPVTPRHQGFVSEFYELHRVTFWKPYKMLKIKELYQ
jgi:hypothetical protein